MMMASSVAPAARTKAEKTSEHFKLKEGGMVEFGSGQRVEVSILRMFWGGRECEGEREVGGVGGVLSAPHRICTALVGGGEPTSDGERILWR